ncbi:MAG: hypothetical protein HQL07_19190 [Nitrospirae bacterium]|nr:hypothetical protein [Magnetococcales bacterium]HAT50186.1 hypothetical protein [Alphaproteobacteria bacterium]
MMRFLNWLFRSLTPYLVGILLGIGFFVLLARFIGAPGKLLQSTPDLSQHVAWLSGVMGGEMHGNGGGESGISRVKGETSPGVPGDVLPARGGGVADPSATVLVPNSGPETLSHPKVAVSVMALRPSQLASQPPSEERRSPVRDHGSGGGVGVEGGGHGAASVSNPVVKIEECGPPPMRPGLDQERYMVCQWRRNCQIRMDSYQKMIAQGLRGCPENTTHAQMCRNFYHSLQMQNPPQACDGPSWYGVNRP